MLMLSPPLRLTAALRSASAPGANGYREGISYVQSVLAGRYSTYSFPRRRALVGRRRFSDAVGLSVRGGAGSSNKSSVAPGHLYVVATPIGNLGDITARAIDVLRQCDIIASEDTRVTSSLLRHIGVPAKPLFSLHGNSGPQSTDALLAKVREGRSVALVSDAGTPCVSDPGQSLVAACGDAKICIHSVPGPSALTAALSIAGFPGKDVLYKGFIALKGKPRKDELEGMNNFPGIIVLYEAPHRVLSTLKDIISAGMGTRRCVCCREMTKLHESVFRGSVDECLRAAEAGNSADRDSVASENVINIRGEFVLVLGPSECGLYSNDPVFRSGHRERESRALATSEALEKLRGDGVPRSEAVRIVCEINKLPKSSVYAIALSIKW